VHTPADHPPAGAAPKRSLTPMMAMLGIVGALSMVAMKAYNGYSRHETEQAVVSANTDLQTMRDEMTARYETANEAGEPVRPDVSQLDKTIAVMQRTADRANGTDAKIAQSMLDVLGEFRPVLVAHTAVFDEIMISGEYEMTSLSSPQDCDEGIVAFMRFQTSVQGVCRAVDDFPRKLEDRLINQGIPYATAHAASQQLSHSLTANTLIQRLDAEIAGVIVDLYTLLRDEWGNWSFGPDGALATDEPGLQAELDHMIRRIDRLERSQESALRRQSAVAGR
jgi:hypothetical protein